MNKITATFLGLAALGLAFLLGTYSGPDGDFTNEEPAQESKLNTRVGGEQKLEAGRRAAGLPVIEE